MTLTLMREVVVGPVPGGQLRERSVVRSELEGEVSKRERERVHSVVKLLRAVLLFEVMGMALKRAVPVATGVLDGVVVVVSARQRDRRTRERVR
jgi:hypothetical protein